MELNRGIAHWKAHGTVAARSVLEPLLQEPRMQRYHLLHAALAELDSADGRDDDALHRLETALSLTASAADHAAIRDRIARLTGTSATAP